MLKGALTEGLNKIARKPADNAAIADKELYEAFVGFVHDSFRISRDPADPSTSEVAYPPNTTSITVNDLQETLSNLLDMPVIIEWLGAANAPTFRVLSSDGECVVFRAVSLPQRSINGYNLCVASQNAHPELLPMVTTTTFEKVELKHIDDAKYDMLSNDTFYVCISSYVLPLKDEKGKLHSSNVQKIFDAKFAEQKTAVQQGAKINVQENYTEAIQYGQKFAELLQRMWNIDPDVKKKATFLDIKTLNVHKVEYITIDGKKDFYLIAPDIKSFCDGTATNFHEYQGEWCLSCAGKIFSNTTRQYTPDYPGSGQYSEHCPIFKYICTAICLNLFELATGEKLPTGNFGDSVEPTKKAWNSFAISKTRLGDLILKGLNNEIDNLDAFITLLKDVKYLLEDGTISADKLPKPRNQIVPEAPKVASPLPLARKTSLDLERGNESRQKGKKGGTPKKEKEKKETKQSGDSPGESKQQEPKKSFLNKLPFGKKKEKEPEPSVPETVTTVINPLSQIQPSSPPQPKARQRALTGGADAKKKLAVSSGNILAASVHDVVSPAASTAPTNQAEIIAELSNTQASSSVQQTSGQLPKPHFASASGASSSAGSLSLRALNLAELPKDNAPTYTRKYSAAGTISRVGFMKITPPIPGGSGADEPQLTRQDETTQTREGRVEQLKREFEARAAEQAAQRQEKKTNSSSSQSSAEGGGSDSHQPMSESSENSNSDSASESGAERRRRPEKS